MPQGMYQQQLFCKRWLRPTRNRGVGLPHGAIATALCGCHHVITSVQLNWLVLPRLKDSTVQVNKHLPCSHFPRWSWHQHPSQAGAVILVQHSRCRKPKVTATALEKICVEMLNFISSHLK